MESSETREEAAPATPSAEEKEGEQQPKYVAVWKGAFAFIGYLCSEETPQTEDSPPEQPTAGDSAEEPKPEETAPAEEQN